MKTGSTDSAEISWCRKACTSIIFIWNKSLGRGGKHQCKGTHGGIHFFFFDQGQTGWSHFSGGRISEDWEIVISNERVDNGLSIRPRVNVKVVREIIPIVLDLWRRKYEVVFGNTRKSKIKNKRKILSKKIDKLNEKTNNTTGKGRLHFENPP